MKIVPNCDDTKSLEVENAFTTECDAITITDVYNYEQNFNTPVVTSTYSSTTGLVVPICWENPYTTGSSQAGQPHIIAAPSGNYSYNYSTDQVLNFYGSGNNYVTLPEFTNDLSDLQISFKWATEGSSSSRVLTLGYITAADDGYYSSFTAIGNGYSTTSTSAESYHALKTETAYLNNVPAEATRLVFRWYSSDQYSCNIDDVVVSLAPSCYPVGTLAEATNITATSADLSWALIDNNQGSWRITYATNEGFTENMHAIEVTAHENYTLSGLTPETHYYVAVCATCGAIGDGAGSNVIEFTTEAIPEYTVTFIAGNSGTCNTSELTGVTVELPAATPLQDCAANGWTFAGWTTTELTENTTTAPTPLYEAGTSYTPSASLLMYAVYMRTEGEALPASYNLVTEEPNDWSGDYLIAYTANGVVFNSSQAELDANNALNVSQYWNGSTIASNATTDAQKVTIAATGNGNYSLLAANGNYFGNTSTSNDLVSRTSPAINNTINLDASGNAVIESNSTYLRMNTESGSGRFRYYGSGQQPIQLYRYTSATPVMYAGAPDCSIPVSYNITVTQVQGATITAPSTAAAGDEVQLIIVPEDGYALNEWQVTTSTGPVTVCLPLMST